jgi:hypothetical protein
LIGTIKTRDHLRSAHFKIDNIETPMQIEAEMDADERRLKFVVTKVGAGRGRTLESPM